MADVFYVNELDGMAPPKVAPGERSSRSAKRLSARSGSEARPGDPRGGHDVTMHWIGAAGGGGCAHEDVALADRAWRSSSLASLGVARSRAAVREPRIEAPRRAERWRPSAGAGPTPTSLKRPRRAPPAASADYDKGVAALGAGDVDGAKAAYGRMHDRDPRTARPPFSSASSTRSRGTRLAPRRPYKDAIQLRPDLEAPTST